MHECLVLNLISLLLNSPEPKPRLSSPLLLEQSKPFLNRYAHIPTGQPNLDSPLLRHSFQVSLDCDQLTVKIDHQSGRGHFKQGDIGVEMEGMLACKGGGEQQIQKLFSLTTQLLASTSCFFSHRSCCKSTLSYLRYAQRFTQCLPALVLFIEFFSAQQFSETDGSGVP